MYKRLKILRKSNKFTKEFIATQLNISLNLYSNYESGKSNVPVHILSKLASIYHTSIDYIVGDTDQIQRN